jgi:mRNA interferase MazF
LKKGEVWWARLKPPAGRRPVVLLSRDEAYPVRTAVTVAPVTTTIRGIAVEVSVGQEEGLTRPCVVNCDSMLTIPKVCHHFPILPGGSYLQGLRPRSEGLVAGGTSASYTFLARS